MHAGGLSCTRQYGLLYQSGLRPIAMFDKDGAVIQQYAYGDKANAPEYVIQNGTNYRVVTDHPGSLR